MYIIEYFNVLFLIKQISYLAKRTDNHTLKSTDNEAVRNGRGSASFRVTTIGSTTRSQTNQKLLNELLRDNQADNQKPVPPNRTSSLQYRLRTLHPAASLFVYKKSTTCSRNSSSDCKDDESFTIAEHHTLANKSRDDQNSIYSSFSLRMSRLSSFNLGSNLSK